MAMNNHNLRSVSRLFVGVILASLLVACTSSPRIPSSVNITETPHLSAQSYLIYADSSQAQLQNDWLIMALKAAVNERRDELTQSLILRLSKQSLTPQQKAEWQLASARYSLNKGLAKDALTQLNFASFTQLDPLQWANYHQLRSEILIDLNRLFEASRELNALARYVPDAEKAALSQRIWLYLNRYPSQTLKVFSQQNNGEEVDAWLQLALEVQQKSEQLPQLKSLLEAWLAEHPQHLASRYPPNIIQEILALELQLPQHVALLLPSSGRFEQQANFIREGFLFALFNDGQRDANQHVSVFNTDGANLVELHQELISQQVDLVVGPLIKADIEQLERLSHRDGSPLTMLALNIPDDIPEESTSCYFALSPIQEVEQAAQHLYQEGYQYPLIIAPKTRYGERVIQSFETQWSQLSDHPLANSLYSDRNQLQSIINQVFGLHSSQQNIAQINTLLNIDLKTQPRSRRDIDAVYILGSITDLTLIKPFIEVAVNPDATPPKLFTTSESHSSERQYEDLTGVIYSDIPLLVHSDEEINQQIKQLWPDASYAEQRLLALGMDAYKLMQELPQMKQLPEYQVSGYTGVLSLNEQCVVQRQISWAEHGAQ